MQAHLFMIILLSKNYLKACSRPVYSKIECAYASLGGLIEMHILIPQVQGEAWDSAFLLTFQEMMMMIILGPHFEKSQDNSLLISSAVKK